MESIEYLKTGINENNFLRLFVSSMMLQKQIYIPEKKELELQLSRFRDDKEYEILFNNINKNDGFNHKYINLDNAFNTAYTTCLLRMVRDDGISKNMINITAQQAMYICMQFDPSEIMAMHKICQILSNENKTEKVILLANERSKLNHYNKFV